MGRKSKHSEKARVVNAMAESGIRAGLEVMEESTSAESDVEERRYHRGRRRPPSPPRGIENEAWLWVNYDDQGHLFTANRHEPLKKVFDLFEKKIVTQEAGEWLYLKLGQAAYLSPWMTPEEARLGGGGVVVASRGRGRALSAQGKLRKEGRKEGREGGGGQSGKITAASAGVRNAIEKTHGGMELNKEMYSGTDKKRAAPPWFGAALFRHRLSLLYADNYTLTCFCCVSRYCWKLYRSYLDSMEKEEEEEEGDGDESGHLLSRCTDTKPHQYLPFQVPVFPWFKENTVCGNPKKCICCACMALSGGAAPPQGGAADDTWRLLLRLKPSSLRPLLHRCGLQGEEGTEEERLLRVRQAWALTTKEARGRKGASKEKKEEGARQAHPKTEKGGTGLDYSKWDNFTDSDDNDDDAHSGEEAIWNELEREPSDPSQEEKESDTSRDVNMEILMSKLKDISPLQLYTGNCRCCASRYYWDRILCTSPHGGRRATPEELQACLPPSLPPFSIEVAPWQSSEWVCLRPERCPCESCALARAGLLLALANHRRHVRAGANRGMDQWRAEWGFRGERGLGGVGGFRGWHRTLLGRMVRTAEGETGGEGWLDEEGRFLEKLLWRVCLKVVEEQVARERLYWGEGEEGGEGRVRWGEGWSPECDGLEAKGETAPSSLRGERGQGKGKAEKADEGEPEKHTQRGRGGLQKDTQVARDSERSNSRVGEGKQAEGGEAPCKVNLAKQNSSIDYSKWEHIEDSDEELPGEEAPPCPCGQFSNGFDMEEWEESYHTSHPWIKDIYEGMRAELLEKLKSDKTGETMRKVVVAIHEQFGPGFLLRMCREWGLCREPEPSGERLVRLVAQRGTPQALVDCLPAPIVESVLQIFRGSEKNSATAMPFGGSFFDMFHSPACYQHGHGHGDGDGQQQHVASFTATLKGQSARVDTTRSKKGSSKAAGSSRKSSSAMAAESERVPKQRERAKEREGEWSPLKCSLPSCGKEEERPRQWKLCERCGLAAYCGRECQRQHWKAHKGPCSGVL